jgi:sulfur-oxidizing protein SoxZ
MTARIQLVPSRPKRGEIVEVRVLIQHNMETGYRRDLEGHEIPRNCINLFSCRYNGVEVFRADLSSGISANPLLQFYTVAEAAGEFDFSWIDDEGKQGSERVSIAVSE